MTKQTQQRATVVLCASMLFLVAACNESSFSSSGKSPESSTSSDTDHDTDHDSKKKLNADLDASQAKKSLADNAAGKPQCLSKPVDVRIVFVLDATGSMQESIDLVKTNVQAFSAALQNLQFGASIQVANVDMGLVTYRDTLGEIRKIPFGPVNQLITNLNVIQADGGGDTYESGLLAVQTALSLMEEKPLVPDHDLLPVVVVITDTFSHNGEGMPVDPASPTAPISRTCDVNWQPLQKTLSREIYDRLVIYDAAPAIPSIERPDSLRCTGYQDLSNAPSKQWQDLRVSWTNAGSGRRTEAARGRGFGFPFTADALINSLPQDIEASFQACEVE